MAEKDPLPLDPVQVKRALRRLDEIESDIMEIRAWLGLHIQEDDMEDPPLPAELDFSPRRD